MRTDLKIIHKLSIKDIKRNSILFVTIILSFLVYFFILFLGETLNEKKRWVAYAVFTFISNFSLPLIYYIRYGDKNRKIISTVIYTKIRNITLYEYLISLYYILIFSITYGIIILFLAIQKGIHILDIYLFLASVCVWCITNGICILCFNIFNRYYIGFVVYIILCSFFLISNSLVMGFLFPFNYENNMIPYFIGKMMELLLVLLGNFILIKKRERLI